MIDIFSTLAEKSYATEFFLVGGAFGVVFTCVVAVVLSLFRRESSASDRKVQKGTWRGIMARKTTKTGEVEIWAKRMRSEFSLWVPVHPDHWHEFKPKEEEDES